MAKQQNLLFQFSGKIFDVVSTLDHPYTSPPIHLLDAHLNLLEKFGSNVLILNWDVSLPGERTYRYDLITDTGLIAKLPNLYHYQTKIPYSNQTFNPDPWNILPQCITTAVKTINSKYRLRKNVSDGLEKRALVILDIAKKSYKTAPWLYTRNILMQFYLLFGKPQLYGFIEKQYANYWLSPIMTKWIPWCILNVDGTLSIQNLIKNKLFVRNPFRNTKQQELNILLSQNTKSLTKKISNGEITPSFDVFLWSLAIGEIKHYGNDFGFFQRLSDFTGIKSIAKLQLTKPNNDGVPFMKLFKDYAVLLTIDQHGEVFPSSYPYQPSKPTRIRLDHW